MKIDVRGLDCPEPLIRVKKFLDANPGKTFDILLDSPVSCGNVSRFLKSVSREFDSLDESGYVRFAVKGDSAASSSLQPSAPITAVISAETIGRGDEVLGRVLMHAYLKTLPQLHGSVSAVVFLNGGVKLACSGSEFLNALTELSGAGVELLVCGTCLDYFGLIDELKIGTVSNMFEICSVVANSAHVINF